MKKELNINYKGREYTIDLYGQVNKDFLEKDYRGNLYINIALVREISRVLGWEIEYIATKLDVLTTTPGKESIHTSASVKIKLDGQGGTVSGQADDIYALSGLSRSCFPNMARVQALAVKNALKWKYPFFEADYLDVETMGERGMVSNETVQQLSQEASGDSSEKYTQIHDELMACKDLTKLRTTSSKIKEAKDNQEINSIEYVKLKKVFVAQTTTLSK